MGEVACWTVSTGNVSIIKRKSRQAARYMAKQEGFLGIYIAPDGMGTLWLYDSENHAKAAKNMAATKGIQTGFNICQVFVDEQYLGQKKGE